MTKVISFHRKRGRRAKPKKQATSGRLNIEAIKSEKNKALLTLAAIIAMLCGSIIYRLFPDETVNTVIEGKILLLQSGVFFKIFLFLLTLDIVFVAFSFFMGTSFISAPLSYASPFFKCVLIGYIGGYFYNKFELKGVLFCLLLLYPYFVITTSSLIFAANESIYMSNYILSLLKNKNTANDISVRLYLMRYLLLCIINLACTAVNSGLIYLIAPHITLR